MDVNSVVKKYRMSVTDSIRFQLITHIVFFRKQALTETEIVILTHLAIAGQTELGSFCNETTKQMYVVTQMEQFGAKAQNIRNVINKLVKRDLIVKQSGASKKLISLHPAFDIYYQGNVLMNYQFLSINETQNL